MKASFETPSLLLSHHHSR